MNPAALQILRLGLQALDDGFDLSDAREIVECLLRRHPEARRFEKEIKRQIVHAACEPQGS